MEILNRQAISRNILDVLTYTLKRVLDTQKVFRKIPSIDLSIVWRILILLTAVFDGNSCVALSLAC